MMRKTITRTLTRATITGYTVDVVDGQPNITPLDPVTAWGKLTDAEAEKALIAAYGKEAKPIVARVEYVDETYEINIEDFIALANKVEKKNETTDEN